MGFQSRDTDTCTCKTKLRASASVRPARRCPAQDTAAHEWRRVGRGKEQTGGGGEGGKALHCPPVSFFLSFSSLSLLLQQQSSVLTSNLVHTPDAYSAAGAARRAAHDHGARAPVAQQGGQTGGASTRLQMQMLCSLCCLLFSDLLCVARTNHFGSSRLALQSTQQRNCAA